MNRVFGWRLDRPWRVLVIVTALCGVFLGLRLCGWEVGPLLLWLGGFDWPGVIVGYAVLFAPAALAVTVSLDAIIQRPRIGSALPLLLVAGSIFAWFTVPWEQAYLRTVWLLHERQYAAVVDGLHRGRLMVVPTTRWVVERGPSGPVIADRPLALSNVGDVGPLPNLYFHVHGGSLFDWRTFGFLYTPEDVAALKRTYWRGSVPEGWTRLKPHWYLVED